MKNIKKILFSLILGLVFISSVSAASGSITASTSTKTAVVGSTFNVTVKVSCSEALGAWQFGISYDNAYLSLQSGDTSVADSSDGSIKTKTYTYKFKAIKSGTASIRISGPSMITWSENMFTPSTSSATVNIKTQAEIEASYSKDNTLKSLTVEGHELIPEFNKDTLNYKVSIPDTVEQIRVSAKVNDSSASVSGVGQIDISEGTNKVEVVVTAQNGSIRTYTIMVDVKDLNPIEVLIDGKKYTVVKKASLLEEPTGYQATTINIDENEIPAFISEVTELTLVGLKDEDGKIELFIYDKGENKYSPYKEIKSSSMILLPIATDDVLKGFSKDKISINNVEFDVFKNDKTDMYVLYGLNIETGKKGYYIYDIETNGIIKYDSSQYETMNMSQDLIICIIALGIVSTILLIITIMLAAKNSKLKKLLMKIKEVEESIAKNKRSKKELKNKDE